MFGGLFILDPDRTLSGRGVFAVAKEMYGGNKWY